MTLPAGTAATCLIDYLMTFGIPLKLYSDCDSRNESKLFQNVMKMLGTKKLRTTGYNAKANGLCEELNGIIEIYILMYVVQT